MKNRTLVAASTLAALPAMAIMVQTAVMASPWAEWAWWLGMNRNESALFGLAAAGVCSAFPVVGSIACGVTAVF